MRAKRERDRRFILEFQKMDKKKTIAVLEDDTAILQLIKNILSDEGYEALCFSETASFRTAFIHSPFPDLVLLDLWLDGESGQDVIPYLRNNRATKMIPIVILSASNADYSELAKLGANDYLKKPFEIAELVKIVKKYT